MSMRAIMIIGTVLLTIAPATARAGELITKEASAKYVEARARGWLERPDFPWETSSDSAERKPGDFVYYAGKYIAPVERAPYASNLRAYFLNQSFAFEGAGDLLAKRETVISAVGDIMQDTDTTVDSAPEIFEDVGPFVFDVEFATGNFEGNFDTARGARLFPFFNATKDMFDAIMGRPYDNRIFDLVSTANNHMFDFDAQGVGATLDNLDRFDVLHTGTARTPSEQEDFPIVEVGGHRIAFLAYGFGVNRRDVPGEPHWGNLVHLNSLIPGKCDPSMIERQIREARERGADLVWLNLHWGAEWELYPAVRQVRMAHRFADLGADVIIGHHPHILQPMERYVARDGREAFIAYSLGNFTSQMDYPVSSRLHGAVRVRLVRGLDERGTPVSRIGGVSFLPFYSMRRWVSVDGQLKKDTRFVPLDRAILDAEAGRGKHEISRRDRERLMELQFYLHNMIVGRDLGLLEPASRASFLEIEARLYGASPRVDFLVDNPLDAASQRYDRLVDELEVYTVAPGGVCDAHEQCLSHHRGVKWACVHGQCLDNRLPAGASCRRDRECVSLTCRQQTCR